MKAPSVILYLTRPVVSIAVLMLLGACGSKTDLKDSSDSLLGATAPSAPTPVPPLPAPPAGLAPGVAMTGDADHDFLRMMSDHHKGLIAMAHETMEDGRGTVRSRADASRLDTTQDEELKQLVTMLDAEYQDPFEPKVTASDQELLDALLKQSGKAYAAMFYQHVVAHHREALMMIDAYLPKAQRPALKAIAERMRRDQAREIPEFIRKATQP